jgi:hypothetical protein
VSSLFFFNIRNYLVESNLSTILIRIVGMSTYDPSQHRISDIPDEYELTRVASIVVLSVKVTRVSQVVRSLCIPYIVAHIAIKKNATSIDISIPLLMILSF